MQTASQSRTARKSFVVVYRTGGTLNCEWKATLSYSTYEMAEASREAIERGGRKAMVWSQARLDSIGLPEGWEAR